MKSYRILVNQKPKRWKYYNLSDDNFRYPDAEIHRFKVFAPELRRLRSQGESRSLADAVGELFTKTGVGRKVNAELLLSEPLANYAPVFRGGFDDSDILSDGEPPPLHLLMYAIAYNWADVLEKRDGVVYANLVRWWPRWCWKENAPHLCGPDDIPIHLHASEMRRKLNRGKVLPALRERYQDRCAYCNRRIWSEFVIDHINPLSRGGTNDLANLALSCFECNASKGAKLLSELAEAS